MKLQSKALLASAAWALAACSSDDSGPTIATFDAPPVTSYISYTYDGSTPSIRRADTGFDSSFGVVTTAYGGLDLDWFGNAYQAEISNALVGVRIFRTLERRSYDDSTAVFLDGLDRTLGGGDTLLVEPRNTLVVHEPGWLLVTDTGNPGIRVFGTEAGGDVPPLFQMTAAAAPWDVTYDGQNDILYASLVDGTIAAYDDFVANETIAPTRTITPTEDGTTAAFTRLAGIANYGADILYVTAPGAEDNGDDGRVFTLGGVSTADGPTLLASELTSVAWAEPVDIALDAELLLVDSELIVRVADVERDRVLAIRGGSSPGVLAKTIPNPSAITVEPATPTRGVDAPGDIDDPQRALDGLLVAANADGLPATLTLIDTDLVGTAARTFTYDRPAQGLAVDALGNVIVSSPSDTLSVIHRFTTQRGTGQSDAVDSSLDRDIQIPGGFFGGGGPANPFGIDIDVQTDLIVVADPEDAGLYVFGRSAGPDAGEYLLLQDGFEAGTAEPYAVDYEATTDQLFVAVSNGAVYVYENFASHTGTVPDRVLTPGDPLGATQVSTALCSVVYDAAADILIVGERGAAAGAGADGAIYVLSNVQTTSGLVIPDLVLDGALSGIDEPLSIAWNGADLWVGDVGTGNVLRFDGLTELTGPTTPSASLAVTDLRAITLVPSGLRPLSGGSLLR